MFKNSILLCCLAVLTLTINATPIEEVKNVVVEIKNSDEHKEEIDVENKVQDQPETSQQSVDRIDDNLAPTVNEDVISPNERGDLETANTFWGGFYRTPSWGWRREYGGYPNYGGYGWGGRGYSGWEWGNGYRGWNRGYYWK